MDLTKYKKVYLSGIGGIGISAIAKMMLELEKEVYGSDSCKSDITDDLKRRGVKIFYKQEANNITSDIDLLVYSPAIPQSSPELKKAKELKILCLSHFEFLGELSKDYTTIAISGTHGKSTTTALLSMMMINAGLDPTIFVGSQICSINTNFRLGKSKYLVVEGDEYNFKMLKLHPDYIGLTSLDKDHLDVYGNLENIKKAFQEFIEKLNDPENLIYNIDDVNIKDLKISKKSFSVSITGDSFLYVSDVVKKYNKQYFNLHLCKKSKASGQCKKLCEIETALPGYYNIYNILIASALAIKLGISPKIVSETIKDFKGLWRRFEKLGKWKSNIIFSDYAHHPTAIKALLSGVRGSYQNKKIVIVFQPHQEDRTEKLFDEFLTSFDMADSIIICPIYKVSGRRKKAKVSSYDLCKEIKKSYLKEDQEIFYASDYKKIKSTISKYNDSIILVVGAGDIDNFARHFLRYD